MRPTNVSEIHDPVEAMRVYADLMSSPAEDTTLQEALASAHSDRSQKRAQLEAAAQALKRGKRVATAAQNKLSQAEARAAADEAAQAKRLETAIAADVALEEPEPAANEELAIELVRARTAAAIARKAFEALEEAHRQREAEMQAAQAVVIAAADAILEAETVAIATLINSRIAELNDLGGQLCGRVPKYEADSRTLHPEILKAFQSLPPRNDFHTPVHIIRDGNPEIRNALLARRSKLINDVPNSSYTL